ncbi:MAG: DUF192 domain-containing protein [Alphaproteobacteria bacterium]|nr:DUF192 domain-containing protein [Alphaproteobacteria bacterium]
MPVTAAWACPNPPQPTLPQSTLAIESATGSHSFDVEVAVSEAEKSCGLMLRQRLGRDEGMLFDYGAPQAIAMWMENTVIPLDMLFLGTDGRIVHIAERTVPFSRATVGPPGPARAVLEVLAGTARRLGLRPGDRVRHGVFGNPP